MSTTIIINEDKVNWAREVINAKKALWESKFPNIQFDADGRAVIGLLPGYDEHTFNQEIGKKNAVLLINV